MLIYSSSTCEKMSILDHCSTFRIYRHSGNSEIPQYLWSLLDWEDTGESWIFDHLEKISIFNHLDQAVNMKTQWSKIQQCSWIWLSKLLKKIAMILLQGTYKNDHFKSKFKILYQVCGKIWISLFIFEKYQMIFFIKIIQKIKMTKSVN